MKLASDPKITSKFSHFTHSSFRNSSNLAGRISATNSAVGFSFSSFYHTSKKACAEKRLITAKTAGGQQPTKQVYPRKKYNRIRHLAGFHFLPANRHLTISIFLTSVSFVLATLDYLIRYFFCGGLVIPMPKI